MIQETLRALLNSCGINESKADCVEFVGAAPVVPTPFRVSIAGAASLAAIGILLNDLRGRTLTKKSIVEIDVRLATASLRSNRYVKVNGKTSRDDKNPLSRFFRTANDRWNYFHCSMPHHQGAILGVLGAPADISRVAAAARTWNSVELESAVDRAGGCAPSVRTFYEWNVLPNTAALSMESLIDIRKIGETKPMPACSGDNILSGIRMLDFTRVIAGPTCGRLFAEYGANVLKVISEQYPDSAANETDTAYGKRKAILNIKSASGKAQLEGLIRECDIFCQAYRPGAMARAGFGTTRLAEFRPGIIYTSLCAFGFTGPWKDRRGFDTVIQSASGMPLAQGSNEEPMLMPVAALDYLAGYLMVFGTLVALKRRAEQGGSYRVDISLAGVRQWLVDLGLDDQQQAQTVPPEFDPTELSEWLVEVPSPFGRLSRLKPAIKFSDGAFNQLPLWRTFNVADATW